MNHRRSLNPSYIRSCKFTELHTTQQVFTGFSTGTKSICGKIETSIGPIGFQAEKTIWVFKRETGFAFETYDMTGILRLAGHKSATDHGKVSQRAYVPQPGCAAFLRTYRGPRFITNSHIRIPPAVGPFLAVGSRCSGAAPWRRAPWSSGKGAAPPQRCCSAPGGFAGGRDRRNGYD